MKNVKLSGGVLILGKKKNIEPLNMFAVNVALPLVYIKPLNKTPSFPLKI